MTGRGFLGEHVRFPAALLMGLLLLSVRPAGAEPKNLAGKWLLVTGKTSSLEGAWRMKIDLGTEAEIVLSTSFKGFDPGWFLLVSGAYKSRSRARSACNELTALKIDCVVEKAGRLFDFSDGKVRVTRLSAELSAAGRKICRGPPGLQAPDGETSASFLFMDPTSDGLVIHRAGEQKQVPGLFFKTRAVYWSPDSLCLAFGDEDLFSRSGNQRMIIVDLPSLGVSKVETTGLGSGEKHGLRDAFEVSDVCWMPDSDQLRFKLRVDYVGKSGNPDIDSERRSRLGKKFGSHDPLELGNYAIFLRPRQRDFGQPPAGIPLIDPDKFGYIDRTGKMAINPRFDQAGPFTDGLADVRVAERKISIDRQGRKITRAARKARQVKAENSSEGVSPVPVKIGERFGYRDDSGMIVIDPLYDEAYPFSDGLARVKLGGKLGYIDQAGRMVIEPGFTEAADFSEGLAAVKIGP